MAKITSIEALISDDDMRVDISEITGGEGDYIELKFPKVKDVRAYQKKLNALLGKALGSQEVSVQTQEIDGEEFEVESDTLGIDKIEVSGDHLEGMNELQVDAVVLTTDFDYASVLILRGKLSTEKWDDLIDKAYVLVGRSNETKSGRAVGNS